MTFISLITDCFDNITVLIIESRYSDVRVNSIENGMLGWTIMFIREKTYSCYVFVCTFIPCVLTQSKCHVLTSSHMLIDYQTGFK